MKRSIITAGILLLATTAFAQSAAEKTGVNSLVGAAPTTQDFVNEAASSDMFEIEASKLALQRGDAQAKTFAQQMVNDHQKTTMQLKDLVTGGKANATLPTEMTSSQKKMLTRLQKLQGKEFDQRYDSDQRSAHANAVDLFKRYGEKGDNAALKAWAANTTPTLQHHLEMAKQLGK
ncbi:DUF4142 domain-containing protein [Rhizobium sp. ZPR3]|uniref:DUF4142 domain-containing protein n=2 Tax=unclassified Rhizobium TaxID=2613769 RepID=A0AAU7SQ76_9HYPH